MDYDYHKDMERRRKIARMNFPKQSPSPPPEAPKKAEVTPVRKVTPIQIDLSSPEPIPQSPPGEKSRKRARVDDTDVATGDTPSPPQIPFADGVRQPPEWYIKVKKDNFEMKRVNSKENSSSLTKLQNVKDAIRACQEAPQKSNMAPNFDRLRHQLHDAEFVEVNKYILKARTILDNKTGLPRIFNPEFSGGVDYPWDIKADAKQLYNRWWMGIFDIDILRGIKRAYTKNKDDKRNADSIDKTFSRVYANQYGQRNLVNGQWWPTQLCTLRDGAHGSAQGGIYGEKGKGAYSIVLSGGYKGIDEDNGDEIWYSGTDSKTETPTENTQRLIESCEMPENDKQPVRVIRSSNLKKDVQYRPDRGFRYDGLYDVVKYEPIEKSKANCNFRFFLVRRKGQDPIRWQGVEIRPTDQEKAAYQKLLDENKIPAW